MGEPSIADKVREFIGDIAWRVFLWSIRMTDEEYDHAVHAGCSPANLWTADGWTYTSATTFTTSSDDDQ